MTGKEETSERFRQFQDKVHELVESIKKEMSPLEKAASAKYLDQRTIELKKQNDELSKELAYWITRVKNLEAMSGIRQVPLPNSTMVKALLSESMPNKPVVDAASSEPSTVQETAVKKEVPKEQAKKASTTPKEGKKEKAAKPQPPVEEPKDVDVSRLDLRVGRITSAKKHPDAESLYVEEIDVGEDKPRTVVSGLVKFVPLEEMQNRMVVVLCNLKPAKMRGVLSEAMVMCASTPEKVEILCPPPGSVPGDRVTCEEYPGEPEALLPPKKKIFEQVAPDLKTDGDCNASYKAALLKVAGKGVVKSASLTNVQIK